MYPRLEPLLIFLPFHVPVVSIHRRRAKTCQTCLDPSCRLRWVIKWLCVERRWSLQEVFKKPYKKKKSINRKKKNIYNKKLTCRVSSLYPSPGALPTLSSPRVPVQTRIWIVQTTDNLDVCWFLQCQSRNLHKTDIMIETVPKSRRHKQLTNRQSSKKKTLPYSSRQRHNACFWQFWQRRCWPCRFFSSRSLSSGLTLPLEQMRKYNGQRQRLNAE